MEASRRIWWWRRRRDSILGAKRGTSVLLSKTERKKSSRDRGSVQKFKMVNRECAISLGENVYSPVGEENAAGWAQAGEEYWRAQSHLILDAILVQIRVGVDNRHPPARTLDASNPATAVATGCKPLLKKNSYVIDDNVVLGSLELFTARHYSAGSSLHSCCSLIFVVRARLLMLPHCPGTRQYSTHDPLLLSRFRYSIIY